MIDHSADAIAFWAAFVSCVTFCAVLFLAMSWAGEWRERRKAKDAKRWGRKR